MRWKFKRYRTPLDDYSHREQRTLILSATFKPRRLDRGEPVTWTDLSLEKVRPLYVAFMDWAQQKEPGAFRNRFGDRYGITDEQEPMRRWRPLTLDAARDELVEVLHISQAYRAEIIPLDEAVELTDRFIDCHSPAELHVWTGEQVLSDHTFETSFLIVAPGIIHVLGFFDED